MTSDTRSFPLTSPPAPFSPGPPESKVDAFLVFFLLRGLLLDGGTAVGLLIDQLPVLGGTPRAVPSLVPNWCACCFPDFQGTTGHLLMVHLHFSCRFCAAECIERQCEDDIPHWVDQV